MAKKRNYLLFSILIFSFIMMAYGIKGTNAWFSGLNKETGNIITTGVLDLSISYVEQSTPQLEAGKDFQEVLRFCARNNSNGLVKLRASIVPLQNDDDLIDQVQVKLVMNPLGMPGNYGSQNMILFEDIPLANLIGTNALFLLDSTTIPSGELPFAPEKQVCYGLQVRLVPAAGNEMVGRSIRFNLVLNSSQWNSPGWSE